MSYHWRRIAGEIGVPDAPAPGETATAGVTGSENSSNPDESPSTLVTSDWIEAGSVGGADGNVTGRPAYEPLISVVPKARFTAAVGPSSESARRSGQAWTTERPSDSKYWAISEYWGAGTPNSFAICPTDSRGAPGNGGSKSPGSEGARVTTTSSEPSAAVAWLAGRVITAAGGFAAHPLATVPAPPGSIPVHLWLTVQGIAALYGASLPGHGPWWPGLLFAAAHLAGLGLAGCALGLALRRFPRGPDLIIPVLAAAIVVNVATYAFSTLPGTAVGTGYATREIAAVLPLGAVLAGRLLAGPLLARLSPPARVSLPARARLTARGLAALALAACAAVCLAALGYGAAQPAVPAQEQDLAGWLAAHDLTGGLGAAEANVTTLDSGGNIRVVIASFSGGGAAADAYQSEASWYDPALHYANFVITSAPQGTAVSFPGAAVLSAFGRPARIDHFRAYTIMVWDRNLLADLRQRTRHGV